MRYLRHGALVPGDLPPEPAPSVPSGAREAFADAIARAPEGRSIHLIFLGCHGGDAASEVATARIARDAATGLGHQVQSENSRPHAVRGPHEPPVDGTV